MNEKMTVDLDHHPIEWPPTYTIKRHRLARHVKFRINLRSLQITVPHRFTLKQLPPLLEEHKSWIIKQLSSIALPLKTTLPNTIHLQAMNCIWQVRYESCQSKFELIEKSNREIVLIGNVNCIEKMKIQLIHWLKTKAQEYLTTQLALLSRETGLGFERMLIRDQQTRWGS